MFIFFIVAFSALSSTQAVGFSQKIEGLQLHAKFGESLSEDNPSEDHLDQFEQNISNVAEQYVKKHIPKDPTQFKATYGPIENVVIPGVKFLRPINLTNIRITGLRRLKLDGIQLRMKSNYVTCNATIPSLLVEVTFDNVQIQLDKKIGYEEFFTTINLSVRLLDLEIHTSARFNAEQVLYEPRLFIEKAKVDINTRELLFVIQIQQSLEEVRYVLAEIFNNPIEDIMDAVLKVIVDEINKELLLKVDANVVIYHLISKSKVLTEGSSDLKVLSSKELMEYIRMVNQLL